MIAIITNSPLEVASSKKLRTVVISEINKNYNKLHSVIDIGSCWGGLARKITRECHGKQVVAVERMPQPAFISKFLDLFSFCNSKTVWGDAIKYIKKSDGFDIGTAYLCSNMMKKLEKYRKKFKVLIVLDFPLPNTKPTRTRKLQFDHLGQHYLYIYENL
jgi:precorrin-6B methylase 2